MAVNRRPYVRLSVNELERLFATQRDDSGTVILLAQELEFRSSQRARRLLATVAGRLADFSTQPGVPPQPEPGPGERIEDESSENEEWANAEFAEPDDPNLVVGPPTPGHAQDTAQPPDDLRRPRQFSRIRPVGTPGLPPPWTRQLKTDRSLNIAPHADVPQQYAAALNALISEIKATGKGQKRYELENGLRTEGQEIIYEFPFTDDADLFEDARVEVEVSGRRIDGSIISISTGRVWLSLSEDVGGTIRRAVLLVDNTALLEALKQRIEDINSGTLVINRVLADAVVGKAQVPPDPAPINESPSSSANLDEDKRKALRKALSAAVTYVWGPPGCGKTRLLSEVVRSGFESGARILVCSNTNKAVDQVLYQTCHTLKIEHPAMEEGRIVRLGRIADNKLADEYSAYVSVDGIVERRSADLKDRQRQLQQKLAEIDAQSAKSKQIITLFEDLDAAQRTLDVQQIATNDIARAGQSTQATMQSTTQRLGELSNELDARRKALLPFLRRSEEAIYADIKTTEDRRERLRSEILAAKNRYVEALERFNAAKSRRDNLKDKLAGIDRTLAYRLIAVADKAKEPCLSELREIEIKISDLRTSIMKEAKVLGTTCTKAYLAVKEIGQVDMVVIDEASMVPLPMAWFVAGLAKERVVVSGDFRQIPPIVQTSQQCIHDILGIDVFTAAGLDSHRTSDDRMVMLRTQYRMREEICALVSESMYSGDLSTATESKQEERSKKPPEPYDGTLTVIDTSELWPFESVNAFFSRFNLMHALLARNLAWHFQRAGYIDSRNNLAICTPYAAQSRLINKLLQGESLDKIVQVGTVHSFQGDERDSILLELPEGYGGARMLGQFLQGVPPKQIGARLINVAVTRAKHHLIVLANLTYLDRLLPSAALLRGILWEMQQSGRVVSGRELLALRPIQSDLRGLFDRVPLDLDAQTMGIFNQSTFDPAVETDLANAQKSIVVFSGFVTPRGVARLGDLLRAKIGNGVKIRCVTRPPKLNGTMDQHLSKEALDTLEAIGCAVDCRARIHEKVVIIDKSIVWHGSLNVLSHTHRTDESMTRLVNAGLAEVLASNLSKRRTSSESALHNVDNAENPRCPTCGARSVYNESRFGPYFYCEEGCGWTERLGKMEGRRQRNTDESLPRRGPACPLCSAETVLRHGKNGPFYGCARFPKCTGTVSRSTNGPTGRSRGERTSR